MFILRVDTFLTRGIVLANFSLSINCPVRKESLISKQIRSDTIDLNNFKSLTGMLKGPDALLEFKESISSFVTGYRNNDCDGDSLSGN